MNRLFNVTFSNDDFKKIKSLLFTQDGAENACFAICGFAKIGEDIRLLPRKVIQVPVDAYKSRTDYHLEIEPSFINGVIDEAENGYAILIMHSHPGNLSLRYSHSDNYGETRLFNVFSELIPEAPHASMLFGLKGIIGRYMKNNQFFKIDQITVVGRHLSFNNEKLDAAPKKVYNRQILAFGNGFQETLQHLKIGIVGLGGTGSLVAEEVVRMGASNLTLVDFDTFEASNITRMFGSTLKDHKRLGYKTSIVKRNLKAINPDAKITEIKNSVVYQETLEKLRDIDIIFSCTDNDWSRSVLNRFSYQYLVPIIDMGLRIVVSNNSVSGAGGRVTLFGPDLPCLWCGFHLNAERIRVESMETNERSKLVKEKYIEGLLVKAPAVVSLNSTIASMAVTLMIGMLTGFSNPPYDGLEQIYDVISGDVFTSSPRKDSACPICGDHGLKAFGDRQVVSAWTKLGVRNKHA